MGIATLCRNYRNTLADRNDLINIGWFISTWESSLFGNCDEAPWHITTRAIEVIGDALGKLGEGYALGGDVAVHATATVEPGAVVKGPAIVGPGCLVAATAYLRGGVFLGQDCIVGPACELKSTFLFAASKVAHLSFVGDSIIGAGVNIEGGAIIANYRNEMGDKRIRIVTGDGTIDTGVDKFGALVGDGVRIGANAVVAPGALISPGFRLLRLGLIDQHPAPLRNSRASTGRMPVRPHPGP
jgi:bifunctional UDP-N-acetylglucosamine pyrophosphorylase / glucosamine-1-phosphate N-acetyltransferase